MTVTGIMRKWIRLHETQKRDVDQLNLSHRGVPSLIQCDRIKQKL